MVTTCSGTPPTRFLLFACIKNQAQSSERRDGVENAELQQHRSGQADGAAAEERSSHREDQSV